MSASRRGQCDSVVHTSCSGYTRSICLHRTWHAHKLPAVKSGHDGLHQDSTRTVQRRGPRAACATATACCGPEKPQMIPIHHITGVSETLLRTCLPNPWEGIVLPQVQRACPSLALPPSLPGSTAGRVAHFEYLSKVLGGVWCTARDMVDPPPEVVVGDTCWQLRESWAGWQACQNLAVVYMGPGEPYTKIIGSIILICIGWGCHVCAQQHGRAPSCEHVKINLCQRHDKATVCI